MTNMLANITDIKTLENLTIIDLEYKNIQLSMMCLDISDKIKINSKVRLSVKASNVAIAKNISTELSYSNQIQTKIKSCEIGKLLTYLELEYEDIILESIITTNSAKRMNLKINDNVIALIKASELSILEVIND